MVIKKHRSLFIIILCFFLSLSDFPFLFDFSLLFDFSSGSGSLSEDGGLLLGEGPEWDGLKTSFFILNTSFASVTTFITSSLSTFSRFAFLSLFFSPLVNFLGTSSLKPPLGQWAASLENGEGHISPSGTTAPSCAAILRVVYFQSEIMSLL